MLNNDLPVIYFTQTAAIAFSKRLCFPCRYWRFTASKRWDQQQKKGPFQAKAAKGDAPPRTAAPPRPSGAPEHALREQLAGLKRKAAFRRHTRQHSPPPPARSAGIHLISLVSKKKSACDTTVPLLPAHCLQCEIACARLMERLHRSACDETI